MTYPHGVVYFQFRHFVLKSQNGKHFKNFLIKNSGLFYK
jgi:hypothetical protein